MPALRPLLAAALLVAVPLVPSPASAAASTASPSGVGGTVSVLAFNDFHGYLRGPTGSVRTSATGASLSVGGLPQLYNVLRNARAAQPNSITAAVGDLVGASALSSALFDDEPTLRGMTLAGVQVSTVGNHEFDEGQAELLRKVRGGCPSPADGQGCVFRDPTRSGSTSYPPLAFPYLAQNVRTADGSTLLPGSTIISAPNGIKVGFVGVTLRATPEGVPPAGVAGLTFTDEASEVNAAAAQLRADGAQTVIGLVHQGGGPSSSLDGCGTDGTLTGDLAPIVQQLSADVPVVLSAHSHNGYVCQVPTPAGSKLVTQALSFGQAVTDVSLRFDDSGGLVSATARNTAVGTGANTLPRGADSTYDQLTDLVDAAGQQGGPIADSVVGTIATDVPGGPGTGPGVTRCAAGQCPAGQVVADGLLRANDTTRSPRAAAQIAFVNAGSMRSPFGFFRDAVSGGGEAVGEVTYGEAYAFQPLGSVTTTKTLTGAQITTVLETQFAGCLGQRTAADSFLQVSRGFTYAVDRSRPCGSKVVSASLDGVPLDPAQTYRVVTNGTLARGGDNYAPFAQGTDPVGGPNDIDSLVAYLRATPGLIAPAPDRMTDVTPAPTT